MWKKRWKEPEEEDDQREGERKIKVMRSTSVAKFTFGQFLLSSDTIFPAKYDDYYCYYHYFSSNDFLMLSITEWEEKCSEATLGAACVLSALSSSWSS